MIKVAEIVLAAKSCVLAPGAVFDVIQTLKFTLITTMIWLKMTVAFFLPNASTRLIHLLLCEMTSGTKHAPS